MFEKTQNKRKDVFVLESLRGSNGFVPLWLLLSCLNPALFIRAREKRMQGNKEVFYETRSSFNILVRPVEYFCT